MKTLDSLIFLSISLWNRCEAQITLFDLVQPNQNTRAFDTLSAAVSGEYDARPMQFDWSNMIAFGAKPISIPTVNQRYRSVLYDGDMVLSEEQLAKIVNYSTNGHRSKREAFFDEFYPATIWENGLPYELHGSLYVCSRKLNCQHGGYTDPTSCDVCKCPDGYGGKLCDHVATSFSPHCGGTIEVTENVRKFEISIVQTSTVHKDKMCVYHLKAPPGKRILINLLRLSGKCIEGCYVDGIETKLKNDKRPVGYRFCCAESQLRRLVSESNEIPLMVYSRQGKVQATFEYTYSK
ncbi:unnamed protein product, partial [Mesorhabditis belari]|uniref:CUB domain-containing protein n=1 Tax=Mesorhabditis belari TaxID=2138241 RepID=A0AAF3FH35_9BILA